MPTVEITWRSTRPVTPDDLAFDVAWSHRHGYRIHIWPDTNHDGRPVTLTRFIHPSGRTMALYETSE